MSTRVISFYGRASLVALASLAALSIPALAQRQVEVPDSSVVRAEDAGVRAHTNHLILARPSAVREFSRDAKAAAPPVGETPASLACVYQLPGASTTAGCPISGQLNNNGLQPLIGGGSQTIAIVDAYDYPTAYTDLENFSLQFGLPVLPLCSATQTTSCFAQVYAAGTKPPANGSWALEESLDIEWAHALAPQAKIVLVEAASNSNANLYQAVTVASQTVTANGGKGEVSMSWGSAESRTEATSDTYFQTPNVVYFASAGDTGGAVEYPSASPNVVSAGGASVNRNAAGAFTSETTWSDSGGGVSSYESIPAYQSAVKNIAGTHRATPDESFDANPNTGVFIYDSTPYDGDSGWWIIGGTSVASPSLAGLTNLAASFQSSTAGEHSLIYGICGKGPSTACTATNYRDITSGTAGRNSAAAGYDLVTGVGSPLGTTGH